MPELKLAKDKSHVFEEHADEYIKHGMSVIPDKWASKQPAIKSWSDYCYRMPTLEEVASWKQNFDASNLSLCLGEASGIIALDLDADDQKVLDLILPILPSSPVEKRGAKGFTRFFRYNGESTQVVKYNGEVVIEILSNNKKTTMPPSRHPNGENYVWTSDKTLLDIDISSLPLLPPFLVANIESKLRLHIPEVRRDGSPLKLVSGRNDALSKLCGSLISEKAPLDEAVRKLVEFDRSNNDVPLFTDADEMPHTEPYTNATVFYANHLSTANSRSYKKGEEYEIPITASAVNAEYVKAVEEGKLERTVSERKSKSAQLPVLDAKGCCSECGKVRKK